MQYHEIEKGAENDELRQISVQTKLFLYQNLPEFFVFRSLASLEKDEDLQMKLGRRKTTNSGRFWYRIVSVPEVAGVRLFPRSLSRFPTSRKKKCETLLPVGTGIRMAKPSQRQERNKMETQHKLAMTRGRKTTNSDRFWNRNSGFCFEICLGIFRFPPPCD